MKIVCNIYSSNETTKPKCLLPLWTFSEATVLNCLLEYKIDIDLIVSIFMKDIIKEKSFKTIANNRNKYRYNLTQRNSIAIANIQSNVVLLLLL